MRNFLYDRGFLPSTTFDIPLIVIGNLRVGGTGKTPLTIYLIQLLKNRQKQAAVISRGYGRKTSGLLKVTSEHTPDQVGDEPLLIKHRFPEHHVTVDEKRVRGITVTIESDDAPDVILLDDAMQHRKVVPGLLIMLTAYHNLYYEDYLLPAGRLREPAFEANRADIIIVTKCPANLDIHTRRSIRERIRPMHHQKVYFSSEQWLGVESIWDRRLMPVNTLKGKEVLLVTGVADDANICLALNTLGAKVHRMAFNDHYDYQSKDIQSIIQRFEKINAKEKLILTTEKDDSKLRKWSENEKFAALPVFTLKHAVKFFQEDVEAFEERIDEYIRSYH